MDKPTIARNLAVLVKGFIAMVMQIIVIRELLVIFNGNELSLGIILSIWLLLEAFGSGILIRFFPPSNDNLRSYIILQILIILSLPLTLWLARTAKADLGIFYAEACTLPQVFLISLIALFLFSVLDGLQFSFACRLFSEEATEATNISRAYILEALGMLLGGIIFTYVFLPFLNSFEIVFLLTSLAIIAVFFLCFTANLRRQSIILSLSFLLLALNLLLIFSGGIDKLHRLSLEKQFPKQKILDYQNSIYGNLTVTEEKNQFTFFSNGLPTAVTPISDIAFAEEFTHLALLYHSAPEDLLIISGAAGGILNEMLKEPVAKIDYAEIDPLIIREIKKFPTQITAREFSSPQLNLIYQDGRSLVKNPPRRYDAVFINVASPTSLQLNRLFTLEFYQEVKKILKPGGLICCRLPGSLTYLNDELCSLNNSTYKTLASTYKHVWVMPGDFNLFLASDSLDLENVSRSTLISRFKARNLKTHFLTEFSLNYRLDKSWREWFFKRLKSCSEEKFLNTDFSPRGLFFGLAFLHSLISPSSKGIFQLMDKIKLQALIAGIIILLWLAILFLRRDNKNKAVEKSLLWLVLTSGFCGIALELLLILGFQIIYGLVYLWVGLLSSAFMFGLALGGFSVIRKLNKLKNDSQLFLKLEFAISVFAVALPLVLVLLAKTSFCQNADFAKPIFFGLSFLAGFLLGKEFPLANQLFLKHLQPVKKANAQIYAADLAGAALGAILTAVWLIPVLGVIETGIFLACLKLGGITLFIFCLRKEAV